MTDPNKDVELPGDRLVPMNDRKLAGYRSRLMKAYDNAADDDDAEVLMDYMEVLTHCEDLCRFWRRAKDRMTKREWLQFLQNTQRSLNGGQGDRPSFNIHVDPHIISDSEPQWDELTTAWEESE